MPAPRRGRRIAAIALSAAAHAIVLGELALHAPSLLIPSEPSQPQPIIPVILTPRLPATPAAPPKPIQLHRRQTRFSNLPLAPLPVPPGPETTTPAPPGPVAIHPAPLPANPVGEIRQSLRESPIGCANASAVGLTKAERQLCDQVLGKGAKTAPFLGLGIAQGKLTDFDRAAAGKEADRRYREAPIQPGPAPPGGGSDQPWQIRPDPHR